MGFKMVINPESNNGETRDMKNRCQIYKAKVEILKNNQKVHIQVFEDDNLIDDITQDFINGKIQKINNLKGKKTVVNTPIKSVVEDKPVKSNKKNCIFITA